MRQETLDNAQGWYVGIKGVFQVLLFIFGVAFITEFLLELNPEASLPNWAIGVVGVIIWSILFAIPYDVRIFRYKRIYRFFMGFSAAWLLADWADFRYQFLLPFLGAIA